MDGVAWAEGLAVDLALASRATAWAGCPLSFSLFWPGSRTAAWACAALSSAFFWGVTHPVAKAAENASTETRTMDFTKTLPGRMHKVHKEHDGAHAHLPPAHSPLVPFTAQPAPGGFNLELWKRGSDLSVHLSGDMRAPVEPGVQGP